jgi:hypothetical protein
MSDTISPMTERFEELVHAVDLAFSDEKRLSSAGKRHLHKLASPTCTRQTLAKQSCSLEQHPCECPQSLTQFHCINALLQPENIV